jgi:transcriptional regulator with PAS, ATPase and Fis domain
MLQAPRQPAGQTFRSIEKKTVELSQAYHWPGNIRELQNVIERSERRPPEPSTTHLNTIEREAIAKVLHETRWHKVKSAKRLGLARSQLYYRIRRYCLE